MKVKKIKKSTTYIIISYLIGMFYLYSSNVQAQAGALDLSFDGDGIVTTSTLNGVVEFAEDIVVQADGKILVVGTSKSNVLSVFTLIRYNIDGSLDASFDNDGIVTKAIGVQSECHSVALQDDGKIVVAGNSSNGTPLAFTVLRFNNNGSLDSTFGSDGIVITQVGTFYEGAKSVLIQPDGKIVVSGYRNNGFPDTHFAVVRYNNNGSLDSTFGSNGIVTTPVGSSAAAGHDAALQADGKIVVVGSSYDGASYNDLGVVRYNPNGSLDSTFDSDGITTTPIVYTDNSRSSVTIQSDSKILVARSNNIGFTSYSSIIRYNSNGSLDTTFDADGIAAILNTSDFHAINSITTQADGKIVVTGSRYNDLILDYDIVLVRVNTNGNLDSTFDSDGVITTHIGAEGDGGTCITIQSDGKILVAGYNNNGSNSNFVVVRYNYPVTSGINNEDYPTSNIHLYPNPFTDQITLQTEIAFTDATLTIYNAMGQSLQQIYHIMGDLISFKREGLPAGTYFIQLSQGNQHLSTHKIIITD